MRLILILSLLFASSNGFSAPAPDDDMEQGNTGDPGNSDSENPPGVVLGTPTFAGTGCPANSASAALTDDKKTLSVIFDQMMAESDQHKQSPTVTCEMTIPVLVPPGFHSTVTQFDFRGYVNSPLRGSAQLIAGFHFSNEEGQLAPRSKIHRRIFRGAKSEEFFISKNAAVDNRWSTCGDDFNIIVQTTITASANIKNDSALITLDTADALSSGVKYHLRWKKCR